MAGFQPPPKTRLHCVSLQCFPVWKKKKKKRSLGIIGPLDLAMRKKGRHSILHYEDISHTGTKINDTMCE